MINDSFYRDSSNNHTTHIKCDKFIQKLVFSLMLIFLWSLDCCMVLPIPPHSSLSLYLSLSLLRSIDLNWWQSSFWNSFQLSLLLLLSLACVEIWLMASEMKWAMMRLYHLAGMETAGVNGLSECVNHNGQMWICVFLNAPIADIVSFLLPFFCTFTTPYYHTVNNENWWKLLP